MTKSQILNPTPTLMTQDTLRPGRPEDPIPRGVCPNASAALERREAGVRENIDKKSEVTCIGKDQNAERPSVISNQGWQAKINRIPSEIVSLAQRQQTWKFTLHLFLWDFRIVLRVFCRLCFIFFAHSLARCARSGRIRSVRKPN